MDDRPKINDWASDSTVDGRDTDVVHLLPAPDAPELLPRRYEPKITVPLHHTHYTPRVLAELEPPKPLRRSSSAGSGDWPGSASGGSGETMATLPEGGE